MKVLINALPSDAMLFRQMDEYGGWTVSDHLLASTVDALGMVAYSALVGPHADPRKLRSMKPPKPMMRPGMAKPRRRATSDDLKRLFGDGAVYRGEGVNN